MLLCNVFHGVPCGLQIAVKRTEGGVNTALMEGRGPAMDIVADVFRDQEGIVEEERDEMFHPIEDGRLTKMPGSQGTFLGLEDAVKAEAGWVGVAEAGHPAKSKFLQGILEAQGLILESAGRGFQGFLDDPEVSDLCLVFLRDALNEDECYLQISRSQWVGSRWQIFFRGEAAVDITAGN